MVFENCELGLVIFWGSYIKVAYTIVESIPYFPILGFVNILKFVVLHEIIKVRKDFYDRLYSDVVLLDVRNHSCRQVR